MVEYSYLVVVVCILLSAFFSGMEVAFVSANELKIKLEEQNSSRLSKLIATLFDKQDRVITTMLIGNNIALVIYGIYMGEIITDKLFPQFQDAAALPIWVILIQTVISTGLIIVTAEFYPKVFFRMYANTVLRFMAYPVYIFYWLFTITGINQLVFGISNFFVKNMLADDKAQQRFKQRAYDSKDLSKYLSYYLERQEEQTNDESELTYLQNAIDLQNLKVRDCMVPRKEIIAVEKETTLEEIKEKFTEKGFSRLLVYDNSIDNLIGFYHVRDLIDKPSSLEIHSFLIFVETTPVQTALSRMLNKRTSVGLVLDEYGGTSGMLTVEDIVEELVGEIEDEHDATQRYAIKLEKNQFLFSGRYEVEDVNAEFHLNLPESDEYETLSGLFMFYKKDIPNQGEELQLDNFTLTADKVDDARIETIKVVKFD